MVAERPCFIDAKTKLAGMRSKPVGRIIDVMPNQKAIDEIAPKSIALSNFLNISKASSSIGTAFLLADVIVFVQRMEYNRFQVDNKGGKLSLDLTSCNWYQHQTVKARWLSVIILTAYSYMILLAISVQASKEVIYNLSRNKRNAIPTQKFLADVLFKSIKTPERLQTLILTQLKS